MMTLRDLMIKHLLSPKIFDQINIMLLSAESPELISYNKDEVQMDFISFCYEKGLMHYLIDDWWLGLTYKGTLELVVQLATPTYDPEIMWEVRYE